MMTLSIVIDANLYEFAYLKNMVTSNFTSKYKVMVFTVFALSVILSLMLVFLISPTIAEQKFWNEPQSILIFLAAMSISFFGCLPLLKMKTIIINKQRITFRNYLFNSNIKVTDMKDYDHYRIVHEDSENGIFEAVWLIKDGKLADSFSTYQYSNYNSMENALNLKNEGILDLSPLKQLWVQFGKRI